MLGASANYSVEENAISAPRFLDFVPSFPQNRNLRAAGMRLPAGLRDEFFQRRPVHPSEQFGDDRSF